MNCNLLRPHALQNGMICYLIWMHALQNGENYAIIKFLGKHIYVSDKLLNDLFINERILMNERLIFFYAESGKK